MARKFAYGCCLAVAIPALACRERAGSPPPAVVERLRLAPDSLTLVQGRAWQFVASRLARDGRRSFPAVTYSATGGSITAEGVFTAGGVAGTFRVMASSAADGDADTVSVTVIPGHEYHTGFTATEHPISEGGRWINGGTVGLDWTNVSIATGLAIGHQTGADYTDATALLTGQWGPDQQASATVRSINPNDDCYQEVELRLRSALSPHRASGYEVMYKASASPLAYVAIARWNGPVGDFTPLGAVRGPRVGVRTGDVVSATVIGHVISAYRNGELLLRVGDTMFTSGAPGMGFNLANAPAGCRGTNGDYGFTAFAATDTP